MATLEQLEQRIADLESQLDRPAVSSLQPTVITQNADGTTGADFTGGVTIPEQSSASPVTSGSFNFTSAAAIVEFLVGYLSGGQHIALMGSTPDNAGSVFANLKCSSKAGAGPTQTNVQATASDLAGSASVRIIDAGGLSSFLQLLSAQKLRVVGAFVDGRAASFGVTGFGCTGARTGAGVYTIAFNSALTNAPALGLACGGGGGDTHIQAPGVGNAGLTINVRNNAGALTDDIWQFIAIG